MKKSLIVGFIFVLFASWFEPLPGQRSVRTMEEYEIKSAYLFKICKFTRWSRPLKPNTPFIISVLGQTSPGSEIKIPRDKRIQNKKIIIKKIKEPADIGGSHVLFIAASEAYRLDNILSYIKDKDILTIGDTKGFAQKGVIINFYVEKERVKFEINRRAAKESPVKLHSQLFAIARVVEGKSHG
jgi:hypothetical protein